MAYAQLDNGFWLNEKVDSVSDKAFRLYVRSISFSSSNQTDGFISERALKILDGTKALAESLVSATGSKSSFGLWERVEGGWRIHDFLEHNRSKEIRDNASSKASKAAAARWGNAQRDASSNAPSIAQEQAVSSPSSNATVQYSTVQNSTVSSRALLDDPQPEPEEIPIAVRELRDTVLSGIPAKFKHDELTVSEALLLAQDYAGENSEVIKAITAIRRRGLVAWPKAIRDEIAPARPVTKSTTLPAEMGPLFLREVKS